MTKNKKEGQVHVNSPSKSQLNKSKRWQKLQTKEYRDAYAEAQLSIEIPFQIRALRKARGWTQAELADLCGIPQARISHIEQPGRAPLSLRTLYRISSAFDIGLLVQFVKFSKLVHREAAFHPETFNVSSFKDDQLEEATVATSFEHDKLKKVVTAFNFKADVLRAVEWATDKVGLRDTVVLQAEHLRIIQALQKAKTEMSINYHTMEMANLNTATLKPQNPLRSPFPLPDYQTTNFHN